MDRAYKSFFRRVRTGEKRGFPRFKGKSRFDSFTWSDPAGWKILEQERHKGRLSITNLGRIAMRVKPRVALERGESRALTVKHYNIGVRYPDAALRRNRVYTDRAVRLDVGCKTRKKAWQQNSRRREKARRKVARLYELLAHNDSSIQSPALPLTPMK